MKCTGQSEDEFDKSVTKCIEFLEDGLVELVLAIHYNTRNLLFLHQLKYLLARASDR